MGESIPIDSLEIAIMAEVSNYSEELTGLIKNDVKAVAKQCTQELRANSPRETGEYASGWKYKVVFEDSDNIRARIYNAKKPTLTHLLEDGHAKVNGGRVDGRPHISIARRNAEQNLWSNAKVVIKHASK